MTAALPLFPTTVVGSMPRPQYVKDLLRAGSRTGRHDAAWQRLWGALEAAWGQIPADLSVQPVVQRGQPGPVLVALACRPDDLLIVGAGQRGLMAWPAHGRVSRYCVSHALCPVLAVPPATLAKEGRGLHGWALRRRGLNVDQILRSDGGIPA